MTYKELVNAVLTRLREDQTNSVAQTPYSLLVGAFVNDAKRVIEDSWQWRVLTNYAVFNVAANVQTTMDLDNAVPVPQGTSFWERARPCIDLETNLPMIYVVTDDKERQLGLISTATDRVSRASFANDSTSGYLDSIYITMNPAPATGCSNIRLSTYPDVTDATETIHMYFVNPQNDLLSDTDVLLIPHAPVIQLAYLYCLYERGEELGEVLTLTSNKAEGALADAIMFDSGMSAELRLQVN